MSIDGNLTLDLAPLPGLAVQLDGKLIVLECQTELAAHYTDNCPVPGQFCLAEPYQKRAAVLDLSPAHRTGCDAPASSITTDHLQALPKSTSEASLSAAQRAAAESAAAGVPGEPDALSQTSQGARRKRKRKAERAPNAGEQQVLLLSL